MGRRLGGQVGQDPKEISSLMLGLIGDLVICVLGLSPLAWRFYQFGSDSMNLIFISPFLACMGILMLSGMADREEEREKSNRNASDEPSSESVEMTPLSTAADRQEGEENPLDGSRTREPVYNTTTATDSGIDKEGNRKPSSASAGSRMAESFYMATPFPTLLRLLKYWKTSKQGGKLWDMFVSDCYEDRIVHSTRNFGTAIVAAWILVTAKGEPVSQVCTGDDLSNGLIIIAGVVTTCVAAVSYERRYHEQRASTDEKYSTANLFEIIFLFFIHFFRLLWILQFLAFGHILYPHPWIMGPASLLIFFAFNIISHHAFERCRLTESFILAFPKSPNLKEIFYPEHFLFPSPTTLACSLGDFDSICVKQFVLVIKDLLPMLSGQVVVSLLSASTDHAMIREIPYFCRVEHGEDSQYEVPSPFYEQKYDPLGASIFFIYTGLLLGYWLYAKIGLQRKEGLLSDSVIKEKEE